MATQSKLNQVPRVILDVLDIVSRPQGSYNESFVSISLLLAEIYAKQRKYTYSDHVHPPKTSPKYPGSSMMFLM